MSTRVQNLAGLFGNVRTRTIIIFTTVFLVAGFFLASVGLRRGNTTSGEAAVTKGVPKVRSLPGVKAPSEEYGSLVQQSNVEKAEAAKKQGSSAVPTLIGGLDKAPEEVTGPKVPTKPILPKAAPPPPKEQKKPEMSKKEIQKIQQQKKAQSAQIQKEQGKLEQSYTAQASALFSAWGSVPTQSFQEGSQIDSTYVREEEGGEGANGGDGSGGTVGEGQVTSDNVFNLRAGDIVFAVLDTQANSDYPTSPVLATVVSGKLRGARVIGKLVRVEKKLNINFTLISLPYEAKSIAINAVAIDPNTARTALATHVNSHYLLRYGSLFATSFMEGYGEAVATSGTETTTEGNTTTTSNQERSPKDRIYMGLGKVGENLGKEMDVFSMPPTVVVKSGTGVGLLFINDAQLPMPKDDAGKFPNIHE